MPFTPSVLRNLRKHLGLSAAEVARRMSASPAQIHRLETGQRRLTVEALIGYCGALGIDPGSVLQSPSTVPVTGVIDSDFEVRAVPEGAPSATLAPVLLPEMERVAALRWDAGRRFQPMRDHIVFYQTHNDAVPDPAWDKRCLIVRADGSRCLGWPKHIDNSVLIDFGNGPAEFDVRIRWASPVLAVMPPFAIEALASRY